MTPPSEEQPQLPKRDSRLEKFLHRAAPVIAAERGMTSAASMKLQAIADEMQLPRELFEQAISVLQQGPPQVRRPNRYERAFQAYLEKELSKRSSEIVTHDVEQKAVKLGETKYQLDVPRARDIFSQVVKQLGKRRISATEAERHVETTVREVVQDAVWVDIDTRQRLIVLGDEWGVSKEHVASTIELYCRLNREKQRADQRRTNLMVAMVGLTVILVVTGVLIVTYRRILDSRNNSTAEGPSGEDPRRDGTFAPPPWWDEPMRLAVGNAIARVSGFRDWGPGLASSDEVEREQAYQRVVTTLGNTANSPETRTRLQAVLYGVLANEPNQAMVDRTIRLIVDQARPPRDGLPSGDSFYRRGWNTIELLAEFTATEDYAIARREEVRIELGNLTGTLAASEGPDGLRQYQADYMRAMAEQLLAHASRNPAVAMQRFDELTTVGREVIDEEQRRLWLTELSVELLRSSAADWRRYRSLLDSATLRSNEEHVPALLEFIEIPQEPELAKYLAERLKENFRLTTTSSAPDEVAMALRQQLGLSAAVVDRAPSFVWNQLGSKVTSATPVAGSSREQKLTRLVELSFLNTIATRLVVAPAEGSQAVQAMNAGPPEFLPPGVDSSESTDASDDVDDVGSIRRLVDRIEDLEHASVASALATFRAIGDTLTENRLLIGRRDLALSVARFLVGQRDAAEQRRVLSAVTEMRRWPDLYLCLADELDSPRTRPELTAEVYRAFHAGDLELNANSLTVDELRRLLLTEGLELLEASTRATPRPIVTATPEDGPQPLFRALGSVYDVRRLTLGGAPTGSLSDYPSQELTAALRQWIVWSTTNDPGASGLPHYQDAERNLHALSYLAADEVQVTIAAQRVWIQLLVDWVSLKRPDETANAKRLGSDYETRSQSTDNALDQLIDGELTMLRLWMLMR
ncbi:MAG: hypothetical protein KDA83_02035 [Planctomycetales bacterium]|nr:hypothetical protein [Planctomycetales bacterium]